MNERSTGRNAPPGIRSRILGLFLGVWYLLGMASMLSQTTALPVGPTLLVVCVGSAVIMAVMVVFSVKAYKQRGPVRQFQLSSLFLLMIPIAIYSAAIRAVLLNVPATVTPGGWIAVLFICLLLVLISTAMLLWFADALMWLAVLAVRVARHLRHPDSET